MNVCNAQAHTELGALQQILHAVHWAFPQADLQWLADEAQFNLPRELDFEHEADNSARAKAQSAPFGASVVVPKCVPSLSSPRVLVRDSL
jgi:aarF domain-containing kinase